MIIQSIIAIRLFYETGQIERLNFDETEQIILTIK